MARYKTLARLKRVEKSSAKLNAEMHAAAQNDLLRRCDALTPAERADLDAIRNMAALTDSQTAIVRRVRAGGGLAPAWRYIETLPTDERNEVYRRVFGAPYTPALAQWAYTEILTGGTE